MWFSNKQLANTETNFIGEVYEFIIQKPIMKVAQLMQTIDTVIVDGTVHNFGRFTIAWSRMILLFQSGQIHHYAMFMTAGVIALIVMIVRLF